MTADDIVLVRRSDLHVVLRLAQGYEPVRGSLVPFAVAAIEKAVAGDGQPPTGSTLVSVDGPEFSFDDFWKVYPRKVGKKAARRSWDKAMKDATAGEVMYGAMEFRDHWAHEPDDRRGFIPYPATWLNAGSWEDELVAHAGSATKVDQARRNLVQGVAEIGHTPTARERLAAQAEQRALGS